MSKNLKRKRIRYYSPKRRAIYERGDKIDHYILFELHGWTCGICRQPINRYLRQPNFMAATVEHIIPLALGGTHTWDNVVPSHAKCNFDKGCRLDTLVQRVVQWYPAWPEGRLE